jgi:hypothetical protein
MTSFPFTPNPATVPYNFFPTLDGNSYTGLVWWNIQGQRLYITLSDQQGNVIFTMPLIESPIDYNISLTQGYFTSIMVYQPDNAQILVIP